MKIVGVIGAIIGFILALLMLSFIICSAILSGEVEYEERDRRIKERTKKPKN